MKTRRKPNPGPSPDQAPTTEILILADGTVYAHNITPRMARVLALLDPADLPMRARAGVAVHCMPNFSHQAP